MLLSVKRQEQSRETSGEGGRDKEEFNRLTSRLWSRPWPKWIEVQGRPWVWPPGKKMPSRRTQISEEEEAGRRSMWRLKAGKVGLEARG